MNLLSSLVCHYFGASAAAESLRSFSSKRFKPRKPRNLKKSQNPKPSQPEAFPLTTDQSRVLTAVLEGQSIFITGSAGTGKTYLLSRVIDSLKTIHDPAHVFVTASTGVAACAFNGQTLHSFAGVRLAGADKEKLLCRVMAGEVAGKVKPDMRAYKRWNKAKALVIDEISMISVDLFEKLEFIARNIQKEEQCRDRVWGGIQLIVSGDFLQLPPIMNPDETGKRKYAFEAECWNSSFDLQIELTQVFRQSDSNLIELLQGIRRGVQDPLKLKLLKNCCIETEVGSEVTHLFPRNDDVKRMNEQRLISLGEGIIVYRAFDTGKEPWKSKLKEGIANQELELCLGARVMLIKNIDPCRGLVNGATGTITDFVVPIDDIKISDICLDELLPRVQFDSGVKMVITPEMWDIIEGDKVCATRKQVPLILAWALSIHKCQGMTLNSLHTDLSKAFGYGMIYVALSRVRSLNGLHLSGFDRSKIKADTKVLQFYESFPRGQTPSCVG